MARNIISLLIGASLGVMAGMCHIRSAQEFQGCCTSEPYLCSVGAVTVPQEISEENYMDPDIPEDIQAAAQRYGMLYNICPELLEAIAFAESSYQADAVNGDCIGLMQISARWHQDRLERLELTEDDLWTVDGSMLVAADYLAELFERYEDPAEVLMIYNGDSRVEEFRQTGFMSGYAEKILRMSEELEAKHGKGGTADE